MKGSVDSVKITILADDYAGYGSSLVGQHGFSAFIEVAVKDSVKNILFDVGQYGKLIVFNSKKLGINLANIDYIILSHRHYDHTGGLLKILKHIKKRVYIIAHPLLFKPNIIKKPYLRDVGIPFKKDVLEKHGAKFVLTKDPLELIEGVLITGEVPRRTEFEKPIETFTLNNSGKLIPDMLMDDISLIINVKNKGLVLVTGCSHAGIVNIVKYAKELTKETSINSIIGGLHLVNASEERIEKTIRKLHEENVKTVHAGHCTGFKAHMMFSRKYKGIYNIIYTGYTIVSTRK